MKPSRSACLLAAFAALVGPSVPTLADAQQAALASDLLPEWAYPTSPPLPALDDTIALSVPGSTRHYTQKQVEDDFNAPDWHPEDHPAPPRVAAEGRRPLVRACMKCHLANGVGHPESADLAGMSAEYLRLQMQAFREGRRTGPRAAAMLPIARDATDDEILEAGRYFSALPRPTPGWRKVVETDSVPATRLGIGGMRFIRQDEGAGLEPIGPRIIELPQQPEQAELRDSRSGFTAFVPRGSLARGEALVRTGDGRTTPCANCHGANLGGNDPMLKSLGEVPGIAGRSPQSTYRQLNDIKQGRRNGPRVEPMQAVVAKLDVDDMIAISAYLGAR